MNFLEQYADRTAHYIQRNVQGASVEVLRFSLTVIINYLVVAMLVMAVCIFTGEVKSALVALIAAPVLRNFSGGIHFKSSNLCNVVSAAFVILAVHIPVPFFYGGFTLAIIAMLILLKTAPQGIEGVSRIEQKNYIYLKVISLLIVATAFCFQLSFLAIVFFLQSITTLKFVGRIVEQYKL